MEMITSMGLSQGLVLFLVYFFGGIGSLALFSRVYLYVTPYNDMELIRAGNSSAAISLAGALIGYALPLAKAIEQTSAPMDFFIWALVALVVQVLVFVLIMKVFKNLVDQIQHDRTGEAIVLAALSIAVGLINAAAMTE